MADFKYTSQQIESMMKVSMKIRKYIVRFENLANLVTEDNPMTKDVTGYTFTPFVSSCLDHTFDDLDNLSLKNKLNHVDRSNVIVNDYMFHEDKLDNICKKSSKYYKGQIAFLVHKVINNPKLDKIYKTYFKEYPDLFGSNDNINFYYVYVSPIQYRPMLMSDYKNAVAHMSLRLIDYEINVALRDNSPILKAYLAIHSHYSAYEIAKQTKLTQAEIGKLRNNKISWTKVTVKTIKALHKFYRRFKIQDQLRQIKKPFKIPVVPIKTDN